MKTTWKRGGLLAVVGGGALAAKYAPQYGVSGPWTLATLFCGVLGLYLLKRFLRGGWKSIRLHGDEPPADVRAGDLSGMEDCAGVIPELLDLPGRRDAGPT